MDEQIKFNKPEKEELFKVEEIFKANEEMLKQIFQIEKDCFPEQMRSDNEELRGLIEDPESIKFIVRDNKDKIFSYLVAMPMIKEYDWLKDYDQELSPDEKTLYLESIAIRPDVKPEKVLPDFLGALFKKAKNEKFNKLVMHARVNNEFSKKLQEFYAAKFFRRLENWHGFGEPFDYLEIDLGQNK